MKKILFTVAVVLVALTGCKKEVSYNNITLDKYAVKLKAGDSQQLYVTSGDPNGVVWRSENEFVATVDKGKISGHRIGTTRVIANNAVVNVVVDGRYDLYDEPIEKVEWGMSKEEVSKIMGFPDKVEGNVISYDVESSVNSLKTYEFDSNNRLIATGITVAKDKTAQLDDFLNERYLLITKGDVSELADRDYINGVDVASATMLVSRSGYDADYWIVTYKDINSCTLVAGK